MCPGAPGLSGVLVVGCKLWNEKVTLTKQFFMRICCASDSSLHNFTWYTCFKVILTMSVSCTDTLFNHSSLVYVYEFEIIIDNLLVCYH